MEACDFLATANKIITTLTKSGESNKDDLFNRIDENYKTLLLDARQRDTVIWLPPIFEELRDVGERNPELRQSCLGWNEVRIKDHMARVKDATGMLIVRQGRTSYKAEKNRRTYFEYGHIFLANQLDGSERMILLERSTEKAPRLWIFCRRENLVYVFDPLEVVLPREHMSDRRFQLHNIARNRLVRLVDKYSATKKPKKDLKMVWLMDDPNIRATLEILSCAKKSQFDAAHELMVMAVYLQCIRIKTEEMHEFETRTSRYFKFFGQNLYKYVGTTRFPGYRSARDHRPQAEPVTSCHGQRQLDDDNPLSPRRERLSDAEGHVGETHQKWDHPVIDAAAPDYSDISETEDSEDEKKLEKRIRPNEPVSPGPHSTADVAIKKEEAFGQPYDEGCDHQTWENIEVQTGIEGHTGAKSLSELQPARVSADFADESSQYGEACASVDKRSPATPLVSSLTERQQENPGQIKQEQGQEYVEKKHIQQRGESTDPLDHPSAFHAKHSITERVSCGNGGQEGVQGALITLDKATFPGDTISQTADRIQHADTVFTIKSEPIVSQPTSEYQNAGHCSFGGSAHHRVGDGPAVVTSVSGSVWRRRREVRKASPATAEPNVQQLQPGSHARHVTDSASIRIAEIWPDTKQLARTLTDLKAQAGNGPSGQNVFGDLSSVRNLPRVSELIPSGRGFDESFIENETGLKSDLISLDRKNVSRTENGAVKQSGDAAIQQEQGREEVRLQSGRTGKTVKGPVPAGISGINVTALAGSCSGGHISTQPSNKSSDLKQSSPREPFFQESFLVPAVDEDFLIRQPALNGSAVITTRITPDHPHPRPTLNPASGKPGSLPRKITVSDYLNRREGLNSTAAKYDPPSPKLLETRNIEANQPEYDRCNPQMSHLVLSPAKDVLLLEALPLKRRFVGADDAPDQTNAVTIALEQLGSRTLDWEQLRAALREKKRSLGEKRAARNYKLGRTGNGKIRTRNGRHRFVKLENVPERPDGYPRLFVTPTRPSRNTTALPPGTKKSKQSTVINNTKCDPGQEIQPESAATGPVHRSREIQSRIPGQRLKPALEEKNLAEKVPLMAQSKNVRSPEHTSLLNGVSKGRACNSENMDWNAVEHKPSNLEQNRDDSLGADKINDSAADAVEVGTKLQNIKYALRVRPAKIRKRSKGPRSRKVTDNGGPAEKSGEPVKEGHPNLRDRVASCQRVNLLRSDTDKKKGRASAELDEQSARKKTRADVGGGPNPPALKRKTGRKKRIICDKGDRQRELDDIYCFVCKKCKKYFPHVEGLHVHMKKTGHVGFVCNFCPADSAGFRSRKAWEIWNHLEDAHGALYGDVKQLLEPLGCYKPELDIGGTVSGM